MISVTPGGDRNTHHLHLKGKDSEDKVAELGLILCNREGEIDPKQLKRRPYPRSAIKTYTGQQKYSDLEPPFEIIAIDDLSGGRGQEKYDEDQSRFMDSWRCDTRKAGRIMLGGQETYMTGEHRDVEQSLPGSVTWENMTATDPNISVDFTASASFTLDKIWVLLRGIGDFGGNITVEFKEGATVKMNKTLTATSILTDKMSVWVEFDMDTVTDANVVATTGYTIKIANSDAGADDDSCVSIATDGTDPYYRAIDNFGGTESFKFFMYNNQVYAYSQPYDRSNSALYMCGYRGYCDSNAGNLDKLIDGSRSGSGVWDSPFGDDAVSGIAAIIGGPGSNELQNFRTVSVKDSGTQLEVDSDWKIAHTTASQYVIVFTDKWYEIESDLGDFVTSHAVADKFVYFAFGDDTAILRYEEYDSGSGTMAHRTTTDAFYAYHILALRDPTAGTMIFGSRDDHDTHGTHVWRARVPQQDGDLYSLIGTVADLDSPWDARATITNTTTTVSGGISKITVEDAFTTGNCGIRDCTSVDLTQGDSLAMLVKSSINQDAGDLQLGFSDAANFGGTETYVDFPALTANEWTWVVMDITPHAVDDSDDDAILSFGIKVITDNGAFDIEFIGAINLLRDNPYYTQLPSDALITGLKAYAGGQTNVSTNCWAFTENKVYEIQADNGYVAVPLAIDEMESLRGINTGRASTVNDVYLAFSLGEEKTERYYDYSLDDVGVDVGAGLPEGRRGIVRDLLSYPGGIIQVVDAGESGTSSILYYTGGWHELYRSPIAGTRLEGAIIQAIPGDTMQRLVISQNGDILWLPLALSPENSENYKFTHEAMLQVGKAFSNLQDVEKFFNSIKLITENLSASIFIEADYKTDSDSSWVTLDTQYITSASQSVDLSTNNDISGIWIEVRVRMYTNDNTVSPYILGVIIESLTRVPVKFAYDVSFRLKDEDILLNKGAGYDPYSARDKLDILDDWVSVPTPIKLYSHSSFENDRWVYVEPSPVSFVHMFYEDNVEVRVATLTLVEI